MSGRRRRQPQGDPLNPKFNDPELQRAFEETRPVFERLAWERTWKEPSVTSPGEQRASTSRSNEQPPDGEGTTGP